MGCPRKAKKFITPFIEVKYPWLKPSWDCFISSFSGVNLIKFPAIICTDRHDDFTIQARRAW